MIHLQRSICDGVIDTPKGGRGREVALGDELAATLRALPSRVAGGLVWPGKDGGNLTKGEARWPLWRACRKAGLRHVGWHVLRHTFASHLVMKGVPLKAVQELLGHASIEMTMRYAHLAPGVTRDAVQLLDFGGALDLIHFRPPSRSTLPAPWVAPLRREVDPPDGTVAGGRQVLQGGPGAPRDAHQGA